MSLETETSLLCLPTFEHVRFSQTEDVQPARLKSTPTAFSEVLCHSLSIYSLCSCLFICFFHNLPFEIDGQTGLREALRTQEGELWRDVKPFHIESDSVCDIVQTITQLLSAHTEKSLFILGS